MRPRNLLQKLEGLKKLECSQNCILQSIKKSKENFGALKLCKNIEVKVRKMLMKNTLKIVVLVLLLGVAIHFDLSNHNEGKLNISCLLESKVKMVKSRHNGNGL